MQSLTDKIIEYITVNRMDTAQITDCMNKTGVLENSKPIKTGYYAVGQIHYIYGHSDSNWSIHEQLVNLPENKIVFVDSIAVNNRALFGEIVSDYIYDNKKSIAVISTGYMRDLTTLLEKDRMMWCTGITPLGCYNIKKDENEEITKIADEHRNYYQGAIAVCDDSGVAIIPKNCINEDFLVKLKDMVEQEKKWHKCVNELYWSTYDTVCLKKYLSEEKK